MSLEIIIGPMFSGKTTELIRRLTTFKSIGKKCIYINSCLDTRGNKDFSTHNPLIKDLDIDSMKIDKINNDFISKIINYDVIGIDESQLFQGGMTDIISHIVDDMGIIVIVSGLNGDFKKNKFGNILDLIPHCDSVIKLYPYCKSCGDKGNITKALFSKRINGEDEVVVVGYDNYIPVCRECYND
jgi:thymidine kinase